MTTTKVKSHGIMFKAEMVRAILEGKKKQTRRIIKKQPLQIHTEKSGIPPNVYISFAAWDSARGQKYFLSCPHPVGTRLWVKENYYIDHVDYLKGPLPETRPEDAEIYYAADALHERSSWCCQLIPECSCAEVGRPRMRSAMLMPRRASRIELEVTAVRVERRNDISEADAGAEGFKDRAEFLDYVKAIHKDDGTENPWVWVYEFRRVKCAERK